MPYYGLDYNNINERITSILRTQYNFYARSK